MTCFRPDGHLTDAALTALVRGDCLEELDRLELAEHLAYCDQCLQRYTELLSEGPMLTPARSCRESLRRRIRQRAVQLGVSRYATAAAAVTLALTLLWGSGNLSGRVHCALASGAGGHCPDKVDRRLATGVGGGPLRLLRPI